MRSFGNVAVEEAPNLEGINKAVMARGTLYVAPAVYRLMADDATCDLVVNSLRVIRLPDVGPLTSLAIACMKMRR